MDTIVKPHQCIEETEETIQINVSIQNKSITFNFEELHTEIIAPSPCEIVTTKYFVNRLLGFESASKVLLFKNSHIQHIEHIEHVEHMEFKYYDNKLKCEISSSNFIGVKKFDIHKQSAIDSFMTILKYFSSNKIISDADEKKQNFIIPSKLII